MIRGSIFLSILALFATIVGGKGRFLIPAAGQPICKLQGDELYSDWHGKTVRTQGVVTADFDDTSFKGFFIQTENCDSKSATSDGIAVILGQKIDLVSIGDFVDLQGTVNEDFGLTTLVVDPALVNVISSGNPLPAAVDLNPPFDNAAAKLYFESLEGMRVKLEAARVVGPTNSRDVTWVIRADLGVGRVFQDDPAGTGEIVAVDDQGWYEISPEAKVGDQIVGLQGVLGYTLGSYRLHLTTVPTLMPARSSAAETESPSESAPTFGTLNLENLFDTLDDPATEDSVLSGTAYHRKLEKLALTVAELGEPAFLALQEAENATVLKHLNMRPEITADYAALLVDGPDVRGIDVAFFYRTDQVTVLYSAARQACTALVDGLGPDGNRDMEDPQNLVTCDTDGDTVPDGNRLFSRPPLVVQAQLDVAGIAEEIWVIAVHWKSKTNDSATVEFTLPRRIEQARFTAGLVNEILSGDPLAKVIVLGDFNDYADSEPLRILEQAGLLNLAWRVPRQARYSYTYAGVSQVLDHILVSPALHTFDFSPAFAHFCADYPYSYRDTSGTRFRSSDHDPFMGSIKPFSNVLYLPLVMNTPASE